MFSITKDIKVFKYYYVVHIKCLISKIKWTIFTKRKKESQTENWSYSFNKTKAALTCIKRQKSLPFVSKN